MPSPRGLQPRKQPVGKAAVLALDLISDFDFPDGARVRRVLARRAAAIRLLLQNARRHRIPVIYANDNIGAWRSDIQALLAHCTEPRRAGAELVRSLAPAPEDEVVLKPRHSAFFGTALETLLDHHDVDTLILIGISAESCVWMTACDAYTRGFALVVPRDTLGGASDRGLRNTLASVGEVLNARVPAHAQTLRFRRGSLA